MAAAADEDRAPLWRDLLLLAVVLLVQGALLGLEAGTFTSDEGVYALQVEALSDGTWSRTDPFLRSGDELVPALPNVTVGGSELYPYVQHPLWPVALLVPYLVVGEVGLYVLPFLFGLAVPLTAASLASTYDARFRRPAFWAAAASPAVVANSHVLWAHAASAALAGAAAIAAARWLDRRRGSLAVLLAAVAGGVLLRSEGVLFAAALAGGLGLAGVRHRSVRDVVAATSVLATTAVSVLGERWVKGLIADDVFDTLARRSTAGDGFLASRIRAARVDLLTDTSVPRPATLGLLVVAVAASFVAGWAVARDQPPRFAALAAAASIAAYAAAWLVQPEVPVTGLLGAWPIAAAGAIGLVVALRRQWALPIAAGVFAAAVIAVNYPEGGGLQWGGRFFSPLTSLLAVGAAALYVRAGERLDGVGRRRLALGASVAVVLPLVFATTAMSGTRDGGAAVEDSVQAVRPDVVITDNEFAAAIAWRTADSTAWMLVDEDRGRDLAAAVRAAVDAGARCLAFVGIEPAELGAVVEARRFGAIRLADVGGDPNVCSTMR